MRAWWSVVTKPMPSSSPSFFNYTHSQSNLPVSRKQNMGGGGYAYSHLGFVSPAESGDLPTGLAKGGHLNPDAPPSADDPHPRLAFYFHLLSGAPIKLLLGRSGWQPIHWLNLTPSWLFLRSSPTMTMVGGLARVHRRPRRTSHGRGGASGATLTSNRFIDKSEREDN
jgi:hypothetical protein